MIPTDIMDTIIKGREFHKEYLAKHKRLKGVTPYIRSQFLKLGRNYTTNYIRLISYYGKLLEESNYLNKANNEKWDSKKLINFVAIYKRGEMPKWTY